MDDSFAKRNDRSDAAATRYEAARTLLLLERHAGAAKGYAAAYPRRAGDVAGILCPSVRVHPS
jgi:hypothetical protein